jgi:Protein of unknown function (DUF3616)
MINLGAVDEGRAFCAFGKKIGCLMKSLKALFETVTAAIFPSAFTQRSIVEYPEMSDPSAAVAISDTLFIVASDEDNVLRVYARETSGAPQRFDLTSFLRPDADHPEADIEGGTRMGDRIFWIGSHGRDNKGKLRPGRHRLFATTVTVEGNKVTVIPVGLPYTKLLEDLAQAPALRKYDLEGAAGKAPESKDGLNIEGLAATPQGTLMIGFRNPIPGGKALIVPLENPQQVVEGARAKLGAPIELSLNGLGVRSIEYRESPGRYLIVAGPCNDDGKVALFGWSGNPSDAAELIPEGTFGNLNPEAMFIYPGDRTAVQFLSDDGGRKRRAGGRNEMAPAKQRFRGFSLDIR